MSLRRANFCVVHDRVGWFQGLLGIYSMSNGSGLPDIALTRTRVVRPRRKDTLRSSNGYVQTGVRGTGIRVCTQQKVVTLKYFNGLVQTRVRGTSIHVELQQ